MESMFTNYMSSGDSDLIVKLIDINSSDVNGHIETINNTLAYLDADQCQYLYVFNKIDQIEDVNIFKKINKQFDNPIMISVLNDLKIDDLITAIDKIVQSYNAYPRLLKCAFFLQKYL